MKKVLLICNESITVINFRKEFILYLKKRGVDVAIIIGDDERLEEIKRLGVEVYVVPYTNKSINPFKSLKLIKNFKQVIQSIHPDVVFTFQHKPNIFGTLASSKIKDLRLFNMVEGLGNPYQPANLKGRMIRAIVTLLYRVATKSSTGILFLNEDDCNELVARKAVPASKCKIIHGIGIDTSLYEPDYSLSEEIHVVYLARLIKNKGIYEFCEIARKVREWNPGIIFDLYGKEADITIDGIKNYIDDGSIQYHGYTDDALNVIKQSYLMISTSYREGFPRIILEAMALARPVLASNVIGNRSIVIDGETGYLIDKNDLDGFASTILDLVNHKEKIIELGKKARKYCKEHYDSAIINDIVFNYIETEGRIIKT